MLYTLESRGRVTIITNAGTRATLTPGESEIDDELWLAIADHPTIEGLMEDRKLIPQQTKLKAKVKSTPTPTPAP